MLQYYVVTRNHTLLIPFCCAEAGNMLCWRRKTSSSTASSPRSAGLTQLPTSPGSLCGGSASATSTTCPPSSPSTVGLADCFKVFFL